MSIAKFKERVMFMALITEIDERISLVLGKAAQVLGAILIAMGGLVLLAVSFLPLYIAIHFIIKYW